MASPISIKIAPCFRALCSLPCPPFFLLVVRTKPPPSVHMTLLVGSSCTTLRRFGSLKGAVPRMDGLTPEAPLSPCPYSLRPAPQARSAPGSFRTQLCFPRPSIIPFPLLPPSLTSPSVSPSFPSLPAEGCLQGRPPFFFRWSQSLRRTKRPVYLKVREFTFKHHCISEPPSPPPFVPRSAL